MRPGVQMSLDWSVKEASECGEHRNPGLLTAEEHYDREDGHENTAVPRNAH